MNSLNDPRGAHFEIRVGGIVRTHRDERASASEAARELQKRNAGAKIEVTDLRTGPCCSKLGAKS